MDGVSTAQHKPVVVRPSDRARWATLHDHLAKLNPRIGFEHMMLLEEVHYTRDPAGGKHTPGMLTKAGCSPQ